MRLFLMFCMLLLLPLVMFSQAGPKVLIFRRDGISPFYKTAKIYFNDSLIYTRSRNFVFLDSADRSGTYSWGIGPFAQAHKYVKGNNASIIFFEIRVKGDWTWHGMLVMRAVSVQEFRKRYNRMKWLRDQLAEQGYTTLEQLLVAGKCSG